MKSLQKRLRGITAANANISTTENVNYNATAASITTSTTAVNTQIVLTSIIININFNKGMCSNLVNNIRAERHCFKALYTETIKIMPHLET